MAGNSVIGALRVTLGLDSAQFEAGLKDAGAKLDKFGLSLGAGLAAVAAAAVTAGAALAVAVKGALDHADALSKAAQKSGTTVETLSRLEYAANLSDVSLESLTKGLGKLSQSMVSVVQGAGGAAKAAFTALGVSVTDANGKLRPTNSVLDDIADRFSHMRDGSAKTALAMQIFGKAGAELIPLLNGGAQSLRDFADESDRTGNTVSTKAAQAAETFNDSLTRLHGVLTGVVNTIAQDAAPALSNMADRLADFATNSGVAQKAGELFTGALKLIAEGAVNVIGLFEEMGQLVTATAQAFSYASHGDFYNASILMQKGLNDIDKTARQTAATVAGIKFDIPLAKPKNASGSPDDRSNPSTTSLFTPKLVDAGAQKAADSAAKAYQRVIDSANDRIDKLGAETKALGMTSEAADRLTNFQDLLARATQNGAQLTDGQIAKLHGLADSMAAAQDQLHQLTDIYDTGKHETESFFSTLKDDLADGQSVWQSFGDAASKVLNDLADKALSFAADGIWDTLFNGLKGLTGGGGSGGSGGNILGSIIGAIIPGFANGGAGVVGGAGGVDSQLFMARATPGEPFAFGQHALDGIGGGQPGTFHVEQHFHIDGAITDKTVMAMVQQGAQQGANIAVQHVKKALPGWNAQLQTNGALG